MKLPTGLNFTHILLIDLHFIYSKITFPQYEEELNIFISNSLLELTEDVSNEDINDFLDEKSFIKDKIRSNYNLNLLYKQPIVLMIYYLISNKRFKLRQLWPLTDEELRPFYTDLGITLD